MTDLAKLLAEDFRRNLDAQAKAAGISMDTEEMRRIAEYLLQQYLKKMVGIEHD